MLVDLTMGIGSWLTIASTTHLGVSSRSYEVLCLVSRPLTLAGVFAEDSDILGYWSGSPPHRPVGKGAAGV